MRKSRPAGQSHAVDLDEKELLGAWAWLTLSNVTKTSCFRMGRRKEAEGAEQKGCKCGNVVCAKSLQICPALCDPVYCRLPGSSVHGILQVRTLQWVAMPSSRGSSQPRDGTFCIAG